MTKPKNTGIPAPVPVVEGCLANPVNWEKAIGNMGLTVVGVSSTTGKPVKLAKTSKRGKLIKVTRSDGKPSGSIKPGGYVNRDLAGKPIDMSKPPHAPESGPLDYTPMMGEGGEA